METTTVTAGGIVCDGCANSVRKALLAVAGVADVAVEVAAKRVTVTHDGRADRAAVVAALTKAGFAPA